ncbi:MAG TPA: SPOR domain-containing protein, partial [Steroidobacteraceae bacterium]|nr:SPOR domain-containing protein [Steroidobacteraceae bacterium]
MANRAGAGIRIAADSGANDSQGSGAALYIINLSSSTTPMALEVPDAPELEGFAVFRSRRVEDGRDRYRLHLGYFESREDAQRVLPVVRARYPAAWVALAPPDSMGSLDDTNVAQFKFIHQKKAQAPARPHIPAPEPVKAVAVKATLVAPRNAPVSAPPVRAPLATPASHTLNRVPMTPAQVLQLLESAPRAHTPVAPANPPSDPSTGSFAQGQKFAVQLIWATNPVQPSNVPQLAIFEAYTLYSVQVERAGRRWYGLRLGFFKDPLSARQVALYARSDFSAAAVVPVSDRECDKASAVATAAQLAPAPATKTPAPSASNDEIVLMPDSEPAKSAPAQAAAARKPVTANDAAVTAAARRLHGKHKPAKSA